MNGTLNASISSNNAAYARIKALEKELEALKSEVNVDTSKINAVQSELDSYKTSMSSQVTATNITASGTLTSNGTTHLDTLSADGKITASGGIDTNSIEVTTSSGANTTSISGLAIKTSQLTAGRVDASGSVNTKILNIYERGNICNLNVSQNATINHSLDVDETLTTQDATVNGDLSFPKVDSNINGEYLTVNAKDANLSGDLQVKGSTVLDGSLVVKDTIAAKNIVGDLDIDTLKVQSAKITDLITKKAVSSTSAVGYDEKGNLIPIKASGGGTSDVAQAVESDRVTADLRTYSSIKNIDSEEYILFATKADDDTYRLVTFDETTGKTSAKIYHYSTGTLDTLCTFEAKASSLGSPVVALIDDKLYYVETSDINSIRCFDYSAETTTTVYTSTDYNIIAFNTSPAYTNFIGTNFAILGYKTTAYRLVKFDGTVIAEDSEYIKKGTYGDVLIPYDLSSTMYAIIISENSQAYWYDPATNCFMYSDSTNDYTISENAVIPIVVSQNSTDIFSSPVDGAAPIYWVGTKYVFLFDPATHTTTQVDYIKIRTDDVKLNIQMTDDYITFSDENDKQLAQTRRSIYDFFAGFDTSYIGIYSNYICPEYKAIQNILINSDQVKLDSLSAVSVVDSPVLIDGKQYIDGRAYDYVLSSELDLENLLKSLYEAKVQTNESKYLDLNIYLKEATYLLRDSILGTLRKNTSLYGLHFYGESKNTIIQPVGFDIPDTPVAGESKYYYLTVTYPMFERSCSFENMSIEILTGQLSTTASFKNCNITTTCNGWVLPFYGYTFEDCVLKATGTLKTSIDPSTTTNYIYAAVIYNNITGRNSSYSDSSAITLIKAQHVRRCTINMSELALVNQADSSTNELYLMVPFSTPSDASFEENTFSDVKSSDVSVTLRPTPNMYGYNSYTDYLQGCWSWHGFRGNRFTNINGTSRVLDVNMGAIDKLKIVSSNENYFKYEYRTVSNVPGEYDLMTNNFISVTERY